MIILYSGTPGSGKSLHSARTIYYRLKKNKPVITNFDLSFEHIKHKERYYKNLYTLYNEEISPDYLYDFSLDYFGGKAPKEGELTLVIDEAQVMFNTRDYNRKDRKSWNKFFQIHRHYGYDVILCCQFPDMLDKQLRFVIEYEYKHRKLKNLGFKGLVVSSLMLKPLGSFVFIKYWFPVKQKIGHEFFGYSNKYGKMYDTFNLNFSSDY